MLEVGKLVLDWQPHRKLYQVVVEEREPLLQPAGHRELVTDQQQPAKERAALEVKRRRYLLFRRLEADVASVRKYARKHFKHLAFVICGGAEHLASLLARRQPLPEGVIILEKVLLIERPKHAVVAPRIATEELVPPRSGKAYLDELRGEPGYVIIWVAHAQSQVFEMPHHARKGPPNVTGIHHLFVMFG